MSTHARERSPRFKNGDVVLERHPSGDRATGTVLEVYEFENKYRCVVYFDDGSESVLFEHELTAWSDSIRNRGHEV
jgi:hypothetical protein